MTNKGGRPTIYTQELADKICEQLADGKSMRSVCRQIDMPAMSSVFKWLRENDTFSQQYAKAKEESADAMAEDLLEIADTPVMGEIKTIKPDGTVEIKQDEMLGHRRLQVDARKWLMAKMKPKKYGDKIDMTSDGEKLGVALSAEQADQLIRARAKRSTT
jgi:hypothetical protein